MTVSGIGLITTTRQPVPETYPVPKRTETFQRTNMRPRSVACSTGSLFEGRTHMRQRSALLEVDFVSGPVVDRGHLPAVLGVFCAFCRSGSACPIARPGLRNRKPNCRNIRWPCRTPKSIPSARSFHAASVLPSPISAQAWRRGIRRSKALIPKGASRSGVSTAPTVHPRAVRQAFVFEPANPILDRFSVRLPTAPPSGHAIS